MRFRKFISLWALLALILGQVVLAEHSASHIDHGFSEKIVASHDEYHHDHEHNDKGKDQNHQCPECVLVKSLQAAFYNSPAVFIFTAQTNDLIKSQQSFASAVNLYNLNFPRAPPSILI